MSATLHAIKNAATTTIEVGGLFFQIRKVRTSDVAHIGVAALAMLNPKNAQKGSKEDNSDDLEKMLSRLSPKQAGELTEMQAGICCAGIIGISPDGEDYENVQVVMDFKNEDLDQNRICVHSLPPGVVETCFSEILELSTDRGGSAERLATFLGSEKPDDASDAGHPGKKVRKNTRRATGQ